MRDLAKYTPTAGMLRALTNKPGATALDRLRCRLRGLSDVNDWRSPLGRQLLVELQRRRGMGHAQG